MEQHSKGRTREGRKEERDSRKTERNLECLLFWSPIPFLVRSTLENQDIVYKTTFMDRERSVTVAVFLMVI